MNPNIGDLVLRGNHIKGDFGMIVSFNPYYSSYGIEWFKPLAYAQLANITQATATNYRNNYLDFRNKFM